MDIKRIKRQELSCLLVIGLTLLCLIGSRLFAVENQQFGDTNKVLLIIGDATETMDTLYPYYRLAEAGFKVVVAGPEARLYHMVLHEEPPNPNVPWDLTQETPGYHLQADIAFKDVKPEEYAGMFVSKGGV